MNRFGLLLGLMVFCIGCTQHGMHHGSAASKADAHNVQNNPMAMMATMTPEQIMSAMKDAGTPGQAHANLSPLVGQWRTQAKMWMAPGAKPEVSTGSASQHWVLGKRFIAQDYTGKFQGQPFHGMGTMGYDNVTKEYVSTWIDSMGTGMMTNHGRYDSTTQSIDMLGTYNCPITKTAVTTRNLTRIINKNEHVFEMYGLTPEGQEFKTLEITYKRKA